MSIGIQAKTKIITVIHPGPDDRVLLRKHWSDLLVPVFPPSIADVGFRGLVKIGDQWFTQYPKMGESLDTSEPEYVVTLIKKIGKPVLFRTPICGYYGFFQFGVKEIQAIAPPNANAYFFVGEPKNEWHDGNPTHQTCMVQFYRIEADTTKQMMRADKLAHDYSMMMKLLAKEGETK